MRKPLGPARWDFLDRIWSPPPAASSIPYDRDYFHGVTSSYPAEGYAAEYPDWPAWLDIIQQVRPEGTFLDIGCAYGFLVQEAKRRGYRAFGLDPSAYALTQEPSLAGNLLLGRGEQLPLATASVDVVGVFDVLEHLDRPWRCLEEVARVLTPDGLIAGATPDPLFFYRMEPTHCHERPAAYWLKLLTDLGFSVRFRFSGPPYNFQFLACRSTSDLRPALSVFGHDYLGPEAEFVSSADLACVPRGDWGPLQDGFRKVGSGSGARSMLYVYQPGPGPTACSLAGQVRTNGRFGSLLLKLDGRLAGRMDFDSRRQEYELRLEAFEMAEGGHHLTFEIDATGCAASVGRLEFSAADAPRGEWASGLPAETYQMLRTATELAAVMAPASMLEVRAPLAGPVDQLPPGSALLTSDQTWQFALATVSGQSDHWSHVPADPLRLPFRDRSFDLVACFELLCRIPVLQRRRLLAELARISAAGLIVTTETPADAALVEGAFQQLLFRSWRFEGSSHPGWEVVQELGRLFSEAADPAIARIWNQACNQLPIAPGIGSPGPQTVHLLVRTEVELPAEMMSDLQMLADRRPTGGSGVPVPAVPVPPEMVSRLRKWLNGVEAALHETQALGNQHIERGWQLSQELDRLRQDYQSLHQRSELQTAEYQQERHSLQVELDQIKRQLRETAVALSDLRQTPVLKLAWHRLRRRLRPRTRQPQ